MGENGMNLIHELRAVIDIYGIDAEIIAASVRHIIHMKESALAGFDIATIPGSLFSKLWSHLLTDKGLEEFLKDWESYKNNLK